MRSNRAFGPWPETLAKRLYAGEAKAQNGLGPRSVDTATAFVDGLGRTLFGVTFKNYAIVNVG